MTPEIIAQIGLIIGFLGMTALIVRKMPKTVSLAPLSRFFPGSNFLQKILMRFKIQVLKVESKIENLLWHLREKQKNPSPDSKYWQELKRAKDSWGQQNSVENSSEKE